MSFDSLEDSIQNPVASSKFGMLEMPDLKLFGRSEQLHIAVYAVHAFRDETGAYPENKEEDLAKVVELAKTMAADLKSKDKLYIEEVEEQVVRNVAAYSTCSITSMSAFLGGFIA